MGSDKNRSVSGTWKEGSVVVRSQLRMMFMLTISAVLMLTNVTNPTFSKYVLDTTEYAVSFSSGFGFGRTQLESIGPIIGRTAPGLTLTAGEVLPVNATVTY
jgi:hypothetical protein